MLAPLTPATLIRDTRGYAKRPLMLATLSLRFCTGGREWIGWVLSGGCIMNSVLNGKFDRLTPFTEVLITSCPDDSGTPIGAALYLHAMRTGKRGEVAPHSYLGPGFSDDQCRDIVRHYKLPGAEVLSNPAESAAEDLAAGKIVVWFLGRMEFGQRALGNRSILLDPRRRDGKDVVNASVKYREGFRPFAPAILADRVGDYFECPSHTRVPFMGKVLMFRRERSDGVPAVVQIDGSGRLQTVERDSNPRSHELIEAFERRSGGRRPEFA